MSKIVEDVKSGLKGIRGAGDAIRGEVLEATDKAFEKDPTHPATQESQAENRAILEKGKKDMRGADEMVARHEWERKGVPPPADVSRQGDIHHQHGAVPSNTQPLSTTHHESERPAETLHREPGTILPGETSHYGTGRTGETLAQEPGSKVPGEQRYA
ncbi:hypothetical protein FALBO_7586 [Fusarium albosuccineum]|uniref:Uncharacterized protein n=1 Tax=Fusarium albosuccineum TaxID=1237068 RepID=A0A8H4LB18_9HYPO|nr:hypothetical protein FALBO_7586 [Fusarium albosuccineum]